MAGEVMADLMQPKLMSQIVNTVVESGSVEAVLSAILMTGLKMLGLVTIGGLMGLLCCYTASIASQGFGSDLRIDSFQKVMSLSQEQTDDFTTGSLVTRLTNDITSLQDLVQMILRMMVRAPIFLIGGLIMCTGLDVKFGTVVLFSLPFQICIVLVMVLKAFPIFSIVQKKLDKVNAVVQENVTGARVVKAYTREEHEIDRFRVSNMEFRNTNMRVLMLMSTLMPCLMIVMNLSILVIIYIGGLQVQARAINVGDVMAAVQYVSQVLMSVMMVSMMFNQFARGKACGDRVREILETEPVIKSGSKTEGTEKGTVRFENVSFQYPGAAGKMVLDNISFSVKRGETIAIIGATGSGKTSLVNLIPRFYDTVSGDVWVDGVRVRDWDIHALREKIGYVLQKSELFSGSVMENILWGDGNATENAIVSAAKVAQADEFISKMPEGYQSYVAEKGASLSGGQKQRMAISRAVLKNPEILIFDDSTSALDLGTEAKLRQALHEEFADTTVIMIAQRIASVMHADKIAVLENGKITAFADHETLLSESETYRDIYNSQMQSNGGENHG